MRSTYNNFSQHLGIYFKEGRQAFISGLDKDDNPYPRGTDAHKSWIRGYELEEIGA